VTNRTAFLIYLAFMIACGVMTYFVLLWAGVDRCRCCEIGS
jgi:hypothetical protein